MAHLICYVNGTSLLRRGFWSKLGLNLYRYKLVYVQLNNTEANRNEQIKGVFMY